MDESDYSSEDLQLQKAIQLSKQLSQNTTKSSKTHTQAKPTPPVPPQPKKKFTLVPSGLRANHFIYSIKKLMERDQIRTMNHDPYWFIQQCSSDPEQFIISNHHYLFKYQHRKMIQLKGIVSTSEPTMGKSSKSNFF